jgi:hypothetical protein
VQIDFNAKTANCLVKKDFDPNAGLAAIKSLGDRYASTSIKSADT